MAEAFSHAIGMSVEGAKKAPQAIGASEFDLDVPRVRGASLDGLLSLPSIATGFGAEGSGTTQRRGWATIRASACGANPQRGGEA
jgi:hypothetical protein